MKNILIVDDDELLLDALKLRLWGGGRKIYTFTSPLDFLTFVEENRDDLNRSCAVIADFKMPEMDGLEMFSKASKLIEIPTRVVMTGVYDIDIAVTAINKTKADYFLLKPFESEELNALLKTVASPKQSINSAPILSREEIDALMKGWQSLVDENPNFR